MYVVHPHIYVMLAMNKELVCALCCNLPSMVSLCYTAHEKAGGIQVRPDCVLKLILFLLCAFQAQGPAGNYI